MGGVRLFLCMAASWEASSGAEGSTTEMRAFKLEIGRSEAWGGIKGVEGGWGGKG
jgi:hypothetical protein